MRPRSELTVLVYGTKERGLLIAPPVGLLAAAGAEGIYFPLKSRRERAKRCGAAVMDKRRKGN